MTTNGHKLKTKSIQIMVRIKIVIDGIFVTINGHNLIFIFMVRIKMKSKDFL